MHLINKREYSEIWRQEGVPEDVIKDASELYEFLPADVVYAVGSDDAQAGVAPFVINYTDEDVATHDARFVLKSLGYPISSNIEANADLLVGEAERIAKSVLMIPVLTGIGVIGSIGGLIWYNFK